jgi:hypothetical protein
LNYELVWLTSRQFFAEEVIDRWCIADLVSIAIKSAEVVLSAFVMAVRTMP